MILSDNQCVFNDKMVDMKQKLHGTLRLGLRRSWDVPRFAISLRHIRQIYRRTTNRTGNVESIAIRGVYRDNRASTSNISEGGYGGSRSTGSPWPKFHRTWRSKDQFLYTVHCLFFTLAKLSSIFLHSRGAAAVGMYFTRVMLGHAEEHPSRTYVCRLDYVGSGDRRTRIRRIDVCVRGG